MAGCVQSQRPEMQPQSQSSRIDPVVADEVLAMAARQVQRCYRSPRIARTGKQIVTRVAIQLNADGTLAALPTVIEQRGVTAVNRVYAERMASAASLAIIRCAPLRLPPQHYSLIWQSFELMFSPRASA
jgi:hypothetical protein